MTASSLTFGLLSVAAFGMATWLEPRFQSWAGSRTESPNILRVALGDSRRLFARHAYVKADTYFHNGYRPSVFDEARGCDEANPGATNSSAGGSLSLRGDFLGAPRDWLERFGRHFFPSRHTHLEGGKSSSACSHCAHDKESEHDHHDCDGHDHSGDKTCDHSSDRVSNDLTEILPWLKLSAELDPERVETYTVGAFWLRTRLKRSREAEQFLREGLQHLPGHPALLFELGDIALDERKDSDRARHLWEWALAKWHEMEAPRPEPDVLLHAQILNHLIQLEYDAHHDAKAIEYLTELITFSPNKDFLQKEIERIRQRSAATPR